jgi:hypothetical protein
VGGGADKLAVLERILKNQQQQIPLAAKKEHQTEQTRQQQHTTLPLSNMGQLLDMARGR